MKYTTNSLIILFLVSFTISVSAEYRLGLDYTIVDNPLPVKKDGVVEVTESFWYGCGGCYSFYSEIAQCSPSGFFTPYLCLHQCIDRLDLSYSLCCD